MYARKKNFSPKNTIILWDLHEVLLKKNRLEWIMLCIRFKQKRELIKALDKKIITILYTFILERLCMVKKELVSEELLNAARTANNHALVELVTDISCAYTPIAQTVEILKKLSTRGYTHHIGSNIGETVFKHCQNKFGTIFSEFTTFTIPFYTKENKIIKKPNRHFFVTHLTKNTLRPEHVIFIDDKKRNIVAAQSVGIHAIHFTSASKLEKDLIHLGLLQND